MLHIDNSNTAKLIHMMTYVGENGMTDYFALATDLARAEGAKTLALIATKAVALRAIATGDKIACHCSAYSLPHTVGINNCPGVETPALTRARIALNRAYQS